MIYFQVFIGDALSSFYADFTLVAISWILTRPPLKQRILIGKIEKILKEVRMNEKISPFFPLIQMRPNWLNPATAFRYCCHTSESGHLS
jgi:hypothetical protein